MKRDGPNSSAVDVVAHADDDEEGSAAAAADRVFGVLRRRRQHLVINDAKANLAH